MTVLERHRFTTATAATKTAASHITGYRHRDVAATAAATIHSRSLARVHDYEEYNSL